MPPIVVVRAKTRGILANLGDAIDATLERQWLFAVARILVTFMYWYAGFGFLLNFSSLVGTVRGSGIEPATAVAAMTILVQLVGSALVIDGRLAWLGAGMLAVFTLATIPLDHHFWTMTGAAATQARLESEEHLSMVGGLIIISILCHVQARRRPASDKRPINSASLSSPG